MIQATAASFHSFLKSLQAEQIAPVLLCWVANQPLMHSFLSHLIRGNDSERCQSASNAILLGHVIKCQRTLISLFICPLTSSSSPPSNSGRVCLSVSARHPLARAHTHLHRQEQKGWKPFIFPLRRPVDLGRQQQRLKVSHLKPDYTS